VSVPYNKGLCSQL